MPVSFCNTSPSRRLTASVFLTSFKNSFGSINAISTDPNGWKHCAIQLHRAETVSINCCFLALCFRPNPNACHSFITVIILFYIFFTNHLLLLDLKALTFVQKSLSFNYRLKRTFPKRSSTRRGQFLLMSLK